MRIYWTPEQASSWVIEDEEGLWMIPAGGGPKQPFSGDRSQLEPLDEDSDRPWLLRVQLVGVPEISRRANVQTDTVRKWRQRYDDFPVPLTNLGAGPVWSWVALDRWLGTHQHARRVDVAARSNVGSAGVGESPTWDPTTASLFSGKSADSRLIAMPQVGPDAWPIYIQGYRLAGQLILREIERTGFDQDFYLYPLVFVYRQYIELHLKLVIQLGLELHGGRGRVPDTHSLTPLFDIALDYIRREWPDDRTNTSAIRGDLIEFDALDRGSYAFRFPLNRERGPSLPATLERFNMATFVQRAEEIGAYLDGASEGLMVHRDLAREMAAEYAV